MPYAPKPIKQPRPQPHLDYYQPLYNYLHHRFEDQIRRALLTEPRELRRRHLARRFTGRGRLVHSEAWDFIFPYLGSIEQALSAIISRRSTAYWLHVYRRIAPFLSREHDGKVDDVTTVLVRQIAELAIVKFGSKDLRRDLVLAREVVFDRYLRGIYKEACLDTVGDEVGKGLLSREQLGGSHVIGDLSVSDFVDMYRIEGLAYEYWKTSASLRTIGKGVDVTWSDQRNWFNYHSENTPQRLFDYYDGRLGQVGGLSSHFGTWVHGGKPDDFGFFVWAQYSPGETYRTMEIPSEKGTSISVSFIPNFKVGLESIVVYWASHSFAEQDFRLRHGFPLSAVVFALWVMSLKATVPAQFFDTDSETEALKYFSVRALDLLRRAYTAHEEGVQELMEFGLAAAERLAYPLKIPSRAEAKAAADFLSFSMDRKSEIALWSGGKRYPVIPHDRMTIIDVGAVAAFLEGLFFRVGDHSNLKGSAFEDAARKYLMDEGFSLVHQGVLRWEAGDEREVDAAIRVGDTLVLFECVSAERPLDFEIGKPKTYERRVRILRDKCDQAKSLAETLSGRLAGRNFDFSWASRIEWRVLSPHHEFLWCEGEPCFTAMGEPRIIEPFAAKRLLESLRDG